MRRRYRLRFGSEDLGEITEENFDFPSMYGRWSGPEILHNEHLAAYIAYSREKDRIAVASDSGAEWERFVEENENDFLDLIESDEWTLEDESGRRKRILIPNFTADGGVIWRWDFLPE